MGILYWKQDKVVQQALSYANESLASRVTIEGSRVSPFVNFPYISVDLKEVKDYETKEWAATFDGCSGCVPWVQLVDHP